MRRIFAIFALVVVACGGRDGKENVHTISREPASIRGWILDVKNSKKGETVEMEIARRAELFAASSVWVEETEFASGGISENGAFIILDVPPMKATVSFNAPGAETAKLILEGVPPTADVFIPDLILEPNGSTVLDPNKIVIRIPGRVERARPTGRTAKVGPYTVPIVEAPLAQMMDRREYPNPGGFRPVATVK